MDQHLTEDARYIDPMPAAEGREAIASMIGAGPADSPAPIVGFGGAVSDASGRIETVLGFLDKVPATA